MDWQTRRKILYLLSTVIVVIAAAVYFFRETVFPSPTCFDKKQNSYEIGIDCGGTCSLRCSSEVQPLSVLWTRYIHVRANMYDVVALVSNKNINNSARFVRYTFTLYSANGEVIQEVKGVTLTPVNSDFPIIRQSITALKTPASISLSIEDGPHFTVNEKPTSPTLSIGNEKYEVSDKSRVYAAVQNRKRMTIRDLPVAVVLFDQDNNAYAVGTTVIPELAKEEIKTISFVWETVLPQPPTRIKVYPLFDPFLALQ